MAKFLPSFAAVTGRTLTGRWYLSRPLEERHALNHYLIGMKLKHDPLDPLRRRPYQKKGGTDSLIAKGQLLRQQMDRDCSAPPDICLTLICIDPKSANHYTNQPGARQKTHTQQYLTKGVNRLHIDDEEQEIHSIFQFILYI